VRTNGKQSPKLPEATATGIADQIRLGLVGSLAYGVAVAMRARVVASLTGPFW
jgi:hypothetical protein